MMPEGTKNVKSQHKLTRTQVEDSANRLKQWDQRVLIDIFWNLTDVNLQKPF